MSQILIQQYLNDLERLRRASGTARESVVREAFKTLLKDWGKSRDLIFIPGHVMMIIGHIAGEPYVIHDTTGISYRDAAGNSVRADLNAVAVTPLTPLLAGEATYVDRIYSIQRIRP